MYVNTYYPGTALPGEGFCLASDFSPILFIRVQCAPGVTALSVTLMEVIDIRRTGVYIRFVLWNEALNCKIR